MYELKTVEDHYGNLFTIEYHDSEEISGNRTVEPLEFKSFIPYRNDADFRIIPKKLKLIAFPNCCEVLSAINYKFKKYGKHLITVNIPQFLDFLNIPFNEKLSNQKLTQIAQLININLYVVEIESKMMSFYRYFDQGFVIVLFYYKNHYYLIENIHDPRFSRLNKDEQMTEIRKTVDELFEEEEPEQLTEQEVDTHALTIKFLNDWFTILFVKFETVIHGVLTPIEYEDDGWIRKFSVFSRSPVPVPFIEKEHYYKLTIIEGADLFDVVAHCLYILGHKIAKKEVFESVFNLKDEFLYSTLCNLFGFNLAFIRPNKNAYCKGLNDNPDKTIYLLFMDDKIGFFNVTESLSEMPPKKIEINWDDVESISGSEDEEDLLPPDEKLSGTILPSITDCLSMYNYLSDSKVIIPRNAPHLLEMFGSVHYGLINLLLELNIEDLVPHHLLFKLYSKFRHNIFAGICRFSLNHHNFALDTDASLTQWLPDCKKTPDLLVETENKIFLIEFTVGNKYNTIDLVKGGGAFGIKYSSEARQIEDKTSKKCEVVIIPAVLENYNIKEIADIIEKLGGSINENLFYSFFDIANYSRDIININQSNANLERITTQKELEGFELHDRPSVRKTVMVSGEFLSKANKATVDLFNLAVQNKGRIKKLHIYYEVTNSVFGLRFQERGIVIEKFCEHLQKDGVVYLISVVNIEEMGKKVSFSRIRGTIPFTVPGVSLRERESNRSKKVFNTLSQDYWVNTERSEPLERDMIDFKLVDDMIMKRGEKNRVIFESDYFEKLCNMRVDTILNSNSRKLLANCDIDNSEFVKCIELFSAKLELQNAKLTLTQPKQTFMYPLCTAPLNECDLEKLNVNMMFEYVQKGSGNYTKEIFRKASQGQFAKSMYNKEDLSHDLMLVRDELSNANKEYYYKLKEMNIIKTYSQMTSNEKIRVRMIKDKSSEIQTRYKRLLSLSKGVIQKNVVRVSCSKKSRSYPAFRSEMEHFNKTGSSYKGIGNMSDFQYEGFQNYIHDLIDRLSMKLHEFTPRSLFNTGRLPGPKFLNDLKDNHTKRWLEFYQRFFSGTLLEQICEFMTRLSSTLFNESVKTYNKDFVKIDNLGFDNIVVLIRGGSKIYKNQTSKLFKVMFYIDHRDLLYSGYDENPTFEKIRTKDGIIIVTPWSQLRQDVLFDNLSINSRTFLNLYSTYTRIYTDFVNDIPKLNYLPFILALHNRRKTEQFMHNSRYLIVNPLGIHANLTGIIEGFASFNYTYLDGWLKERIKREYFNFGSKIAYIRKLKAGKIDALLNQYELKDLWLDQPIVNADHLTTFIYMTYMMTKAPVNSSIEQSSNLWEILEDVKEFNSAHNDVNGMNDQSLRFNVLDFDEKVYDDDYKYDPVFCQYLGHHLAGYMENMTSLMEVENYWNNLKNQDIDHIANSNGLRGWNSKNFFNKKGYEIVFSKIDELLDDIDLTERIDSYLNSDLLTSAELVKSDRINKNDVIDPYEDLIFHIVHKIQRGGGREIFCMDLNTKLQQNPLEKMFKFLCKKIPNEFISIPSNKRHGIIHSDFYEKGPQGWNKKIYRWVLDCRRWAPHSVFQKFVHFIEGLSPILPPDFLDEFRDFSEKMFKKRFITREHVLSKMRNNVKFKDYEHFLNKMDKVADGFEMTVKFSFVMGIFNYLSTLLHAANQIVASEVIRNQCLSNNLGLVILDAKCHSDDSVVSSYHESESSSRLTFLLYDWLLKGANHMLSIKKSQINEDVYLEFLSILYLFDRFLPVLPKFSSTIPFKPSDKGYSADISFSITQCVEMLSQGGSFDECFLILKLTERFIQNIYNLNYNKKLPFNLLGVIDSHPLELLYAGGMADLARSMIFDPDITWKAINTCTNLKLFDLEQAEIGLNWDMGAMIKGKTMRNWNTYESILEKLNEKVPWTINNSKLGNSSLNMLWYVNKLKDRSFYSSLVDEPIARRFSRIFGSGKYRQILTKEGERYDVNKLSVLLHEIDDLPEIDTTPNDFYTKFIEIVCRDLYQFYKALEGSEIINTIQSNLKEKPVVFRQGESLLGNMTVNSTDYTIYVKEPEGFKLLGKRSNPYREIEKISNHLTMIGVDWEKMSADQLSTVSRRVLKEDSREYRLIAPVKGDKRRIENFTDVLYMLETNSYKHLKLNIKNKAAQVLDWNRKVIQGKVPKEVKDYIDAFWTNQLLIDYKLMDKDIFIKKPQDRMNELLSNISEDWLPLLNSSLKTEDKTLAELDFWSYWSHEQIKIAGQWYGSGNCILNLPDLIVNTSVSNGIIERIEFETDHVGMFSLAVSWYLNIFFRQSGLHAELISSDFSDPSTIYLGYNSKDALFGIGRGKRFDSIFPNSVQGHNLLPGFAYKEMKRVKQGRYHYYREKNTNTDYKISFFLPTDEPATVNFQEYLNFDNIRNLQEDNEIQNFIKDMSFKNMGTVVKEFDALIDNIGRSLLYHICYNYEDSLNIYQGQKTADDPLLLSIIQWKKTHPEFGFKTEEELAALLKQKDIPNIPNKVYNLLIKLGHGRLSETDYRNIIQKTLTLKDDERERYLISCYPFLSSDNRNASLAIVMRSKRIYKCCKRLRGMGYRLIVPLIDSIAESIEAGNLYSPILMSYKSQFETARSTTYNPKLIFKIICTRALLDSITITQVYCHYNQNVNLMLNIINELVEQGLLNWLGLCTENDPLLRTVEFQVDGQVFINWMIDLLDCCFIETSKEINRLRVKNIKTLFFEGGVLSVYFSQIRPIAIRMKLMDFPEIIELNIKRYRKKMIEGKKKKFTKIEKVMLKKSKNPVCGIISKEFKPLNEYWQDELDSMPTWESDIIDDVEFEEEPHTLESLSYHHSFYLDKHEITKVRGTSWNVIISCSMFDKNCWTVTGEKAIFKKSNLSTNPYEHFSDINNFIFYVGVRKVNFTIDGYDMLKWEESFKIGNPGSISNTKIEIADKEYEKLEAISRPNLVAQLDNIDNYFQKMTTQTALEFYKETEKKLEFIEENFETKKKFDEDRKELKNMVDDYIKEKEKAERVDDADFAVKDKLEAKAAFKMEDFIDKMKDILGEIADTGNYIEGMMSQKSKIVTEIETEYNLYKFKQPLELLSDLEFRAEFETLFPGMWDPFINGELNITKGSLTDRLDLARMRIDKMPGPMRRKYRKLYLIVSIFLNSLQIVRRMDPKSQELGYMVDELFRVDYESDEEHEVLTSELLPDNRLELPYELNYI